MIKKVAFLCAVAFAVTTVSCKKEDAASKIDANATEVAPGQSTPNPDPNIGGPQAQEPAKPAPPADGKYPVMTFEKTEHDFGSIKSGDKVQYIFKFKNTGEADLLISKASGSCGCTVPEFPKDPVKPGQSAEMKVSFNSAGKHGQQHGCRLHQYRSGPGKINDQSFHHGRYNT
jgi:uncharacterized protein DUF1573